MSKKIKNPSTKDKSSYGYFYDDGFESDDERCGVYFDQFGRRQYPATTDKDKPIRTFMHYTEPRENQSGINVFGREEKGLFYNYDDRIGHTPCSEGGPKFFDCLGQVVSESGLQTWTNGLTARMIEKALSMYHGKPIDLRHVILGCNMSNGYSWLCFGYVVGE